MADILGTSGADTIEATNSDDVVTVGRGGDVVQAGDGNDTVFGGAGDNRLIGDNGPDNLLINGSFEADHDVIDLPSYGLEYSDLANLMTDKGWATEIDLSGLTGGGTEDKLILKSNDLNDLNEDNFIL